MFLNGRDIKITDAARLGILGKAPLHCATKPELFIPRCQGSVPIPGMQRGSGISPVHPVTLA